jgi:predicted GNAT family N-acyltransferase
MLLVELQNAARSRCGSNWPRSKKNLASPLSRSEKNTTGRLFHVAWKHLIPTSTSVPVKTRESTRRHPFVATTDGQTIAGYYTLSQFAIGLDAIPEEVAKRLPKYPMVAATLLGRLAVSTEFRGQGVGKILLMDALHHSLDSSKQMASAGVILDAKGEFLAGFYRRYGFVEVSKIEERLFLPMGTVEQLFRKGR